MLKLGLAAANLIATRPTKDDVRRVVLATAYGVIMALCGIASMACVLASIWLYAIPFLGAAGAPLVVALILLIGAAIAYGLSHRRRAPAPPPTNAGINADLVLQDLARLTRENKTAMLLAALIAGLDLGTRR